MFDHQPRIKPDVADICFSGRILLRVFQQTGEKAGRQRRIVARIVCIRQNQHLFGTGAGNIEKPRFLLHLLFLTGLVLFDRTVTGKNVIDAVKQNDRIKFQPLCRVNGGQGQSGIGALGVLGNHLVQLVDAVQKLLDGADPRGKACQDTKFLRLHRIGVSA